MTALELELVALGDQLDHGDGNELATLVLQRIRQRSQRDAPTWVKVAAAVLLAVAIALVVPGSRRAFARWLGIGAIDVRPVATTVATGPPSQTVPGAVVTTSAREPASTVIASSTTGSRGSGESGASVDASLDAARATVSFRILTAAAGAGAMQRVDTDQRVPGGLVAITYERFTLVELAAEPNSHPIMLKLAPEGVTTTPSRVNGADAVWLEGAHEVAYVAPGGEIRSDTVRRSGSVLLWTVGSVTLRIEGVGTIEDAVRIASDVH